MRAWAVINLKTGDIIHRFRTYYDALTYATILQRKSFPAGVVFRK